MSALQPPPPRGQLRIDDMMGKPSRRVSAEPNISGKYDDTAFCFACECRPVGAAVPTSWTQLQELLRESAHMALAARVRMVGEFYDEVVRPASGREWTRASIEEHLSVHMEDSAGMYALLLAQVSGELGTWGEELGWRRECAHRA